MVGRFQTFLAVSLVLALTCVAYEDSKSIQFKDCGSEEAKVTSVDITPCSTSPCHVVPGKNSTIGVTFTATAAADKIKSKAYGSIAGIRVPYPLPQPDACEKSNITCPLKAAATYDYKLTLPIPTGLPRVDVVVELDMIAGDGKKVVCIQLPLVVTPSGVQQQQLHP